MSTNNYTLIEAIIKDDTAQWVEKFTPFGLLTEDECRQELDGYIAYFNKTLRPNELPRTLVSFTYVHKSRYV